eukprot:1459664-Rhodomonas_salina.1
MPSSAPHPAVPVHCPRAPHQETRSPSIQRDAVCIPAFLAPSYRRMHARAADVASPSPAGYASG